jgi:hypothetical protein
MPFVIKKPPRLERHISYLSGSVLNSDTELPPIKEISHCLHSIKGVISIKEGTTTLHIDTVLIDTLELLSTVLLGTSG